MKHANTQRSVLAMIFLMAAAMAPAAWGARLDDTAIFFEINDTDGDAGIQLFLDGEGWDSMQVRDPDGDVILNIAAEDSIGLQGITELFFESAEPSFDVQTLDELLALFPEGTYRFKGTTTGGRKLKGKARLTHALPNAPNFLRPQENQPVFFDDAVVEWQLVPDPPGSRIVGYEVIVENEDDRTFAVELPRAGRSIRLPPEFMEPNTEYKVEILAIEKSGNKTISEREFTTRP